MPKHMNNHLAGWPFKLTYSLLFSFLFTQIAFGLDGPIPAGCKDFISPIGRLSYENDTHKNWYASWWDGKCEGLPSWPFCQAKPYWSTVIEPVLEANPGADRKSLLRELCRLGELIGYEFARDNTWRCIDRNDLSAWVESFSSTDGNIYQKIVAVRTEAERKIRIANPILSLLKTLKRMTLTHITQV